MKKVLAFIVLVAIFVTGAKFHNINAADTAFAELPPAYPVGDGGS